VLEGLEDRTLLNGTVFVVPATQPITDPTTQFTSISAAVQSPVVRLGGVVQIEPGAVPGTLAQADLTAQGNGAAATAGVNLLIRADPAADPAAINPIVINAALATGAAASGFQLQNVKVSLVTAGSLTLGADGAISGTSFVNVSSNATSALALNSAHDNLINSTFTNNSTALPATFSLVGVNPPAAGSSNLISGNIFVGNTANAGTRTLLAYSVAAAGVPVTDQVVNNSFVGNTGSNLSGLLSVTGPATADALQNQLTIQNNTFIGRDAITNGIQLTNNGNAATTVAVKMNANNIQLVGAAGIALTVPPAGAANSINASILAHQINTAGNGNGISINIGAAAAGTVVLRVEGTDFHFNKFGVNVFVTAGATLNGGNVDLGGGTTALGTSLGGNNFRSFTTTATPALGGAIVVVGTITAGTTIKAQQNIFATGVTPGNVIFPNNSAQIDVTNPLSSNQAFIDTLYEAFLKRAGRITDATDAGGWVTILGPNPPSAQFVNAVVNGIALSPEGLGIVVEGLYQKILGRPSDATGKTNFVNFLKNGGSVEQAIVGMATSPEYANLSGNNTVTFVRSLYTKILGRASSGPPDVTDAEVTGWVNAAQAQGRAFVVNGFVTSTEFRSPIVEQLYGFPANPLPPIAGLLSSLLHRSKDPRTNDTQSFNAWVSTPIDVLTMELDFAKSAEFNQS
jgi:hypothetical protein